MARLGLETEIKDTATCQRTVEHFRKAGIVLPTFSQLAAPETIPASIRAALDKVDPDAPHPLNLFRVHWFNGVNRRDQVAVPEYVTLPSSLTGVRARIVVALGAFFPMITAHKVLAAYGCLAPRLVTGQFDPSRDRAIWPSTGNYCRGGVAISRIMGCHGVAVLPENMSRERFDWLDRWVLEPSDIVRTPGSESNVKEIYDTCNLLDKDPQNIIFNQFCEFGNHLVHVTVTGPALERIFRAVSAGDTTATCRGFVSATGSAGSIAAGDHLKDVFGTQIVAVEALECPTLLYNGFGEHNIQGIGDKHVPYIHNVLNTDYVAGVSDAATDALGLLFHHPAGRAYLAERRGIAPELLDRLAFLGFSGLANVLAAIKLAKYADLGPSDYILTLGTDGAAMYGSEFQRILQHRFAGHFDTLSAAEVYSEFMRGQQIDHLLELTHRDKARIFNLGYYTWVEQQGVSLAEFEARRAPSFWKSLRALVPVWDRLIDEFNHQTGLVPQA